MLKAKSSIKNQKGLATIEIIPILTVFVLLINFSLGFFGIVHSGILNSIAARNYAFETFRNRANLNYLRDIEGSAPVRYANVGIRFHGIISENTNRDDWVVTQRPLKFTDLSQESVFKGTVTEHNELRRIQEGLRASESGVEEGVSPAWIRTLYGICLDSKCGGNG